MLLDDLRAGLAELETLDLRRARRCLQSPCGTRVEVDGRAMLSFCSNDYLGLAADPRLRDALAEGARLWGAGAGASHLVSGHYQPHEQLEHALAAFVGCQRALSFSTGFMANCGTIAALVGHDGEIFADRLNHASLVDGALLSRAKFNRYPHFRLDMLERQLAASSARHKLIISDTVFSMDGDLAPLPELFALAERFDALLMIDDAHGLGVLGPQGRGALLHFGLTSPRIVYVGTLGKAAGLAGAFVAGDAVVIDWLMQKTRSYIFTTAAPPALASALCVAVELMRDADDRRAHLRRLIARLRDGLGDTPWQLADSQTPIQPVVIGENRAATTLAAKLWNEGLWIPAIRPPTVPKGSARLRISLSAAHHSDDVDRLVDALQRLVPRQ